ncbi:MAG TPA: DUF5060 domain-containing protein [Bryobacteraceae bacterium]|nr:DUF5060 domain-containing protein [Bryobacteraceae bacterium]
MIPSALVRPTESLSRLAAALAFATAAAAQTACPPTPVYGRCELTFELSADELKSHPNPYLTVQLHAEFRSPKHRTFLMLGFWDGGNRMIIRFAPVDDGDWDYRVTSNVPRFDGKTGNFIATAFDTPGFIMPRNVHHWSYTERNVPHLWMGDTRYDLVSMDGGEFRKYVDRRAAQRFNHMRGVVLGRKTDAAAYPSADRPDPDHFRRLDERLAYLNSKGIIADLILGWDENHLAKLFPTWQQRERYLRYLVARYSAYNVTWQIVQEFEEYELTRDLHKELGAALKKMDPYNHPRTTHTVATSAPLLGDGWMDHVLYQSSDNQLGAIEHQVYPVPFVNSEFGYEDSGAGRTHPHHVDPNEFRRRLWNATMNGQYPTFGNTGTYGSTGLPQDLKYLESPGARAMTVWFEFFAGTRHWELEPFFDLDGGRALALPGVEYIVYVEKLSGPIEVRVEKHSYDVRWVNPANGEVTKLKEMKSDKFVLEPPDRSHDWVLHISREGRKEGMKSYKFESRPNLMQEVETVAKVVPFEVAQPAKDELSVAIPPRYEVRLNRQTRGTRAMMYLWTGEVSVEGQGYRILGTGPEGTLRLPRNLARRYPAILNLRLYGMNANGKVYALDRIYHLTQ